MTAQECLKKGEYCDELAKVAPSVEEREFLHQLAEEWRALGGHDSYYKLCQTVART